MKFLERRESKRLKEQQRKEQLKMIKMINIVRDVLAVFICLISFTLILGGEVLSGIFLSIFAFSITSHFGILVKRFGINLNNVMRVIISFCLFIMAGAFLTSNENVEQVVLAPTETPAVTPTPIISPVESCVNEFNLDENWCEVMVEKIPNFEIKEVESVGNNSRKVTMTSGESYYLVTKSEEVMAITTSEENKEVRTNLYESPNLKPETIEEELNLFEGYTLVSVDTCDLDGSRIPNVVVDIGFGDREYWAFTNEYGQLVKVVAKEIILQDDGNESVTDKGRYCGDEAKVPGTEDSDLDEGHVIADSLGGVSNAYNITPQNSTLNRHGDQAYMEKTIRDAGGATDFVAEISYPDTTTMIPSHYKYTYTVWGNVVVDEFDNVNPETTIPTNNSNNGSSSSNNYTKPETSVEQPTYNEPQGQMVWKSATGSKYHSIPNCGKMNPNKAVQITVEQALSQGLEACSKCY